MSDDTWVIPGLDVTETALVATLCTSSPYSTLFRAHIEYCANGQRFENCHTVVEYARAVLKHRLEYLDEPNPEA